MGDTYPNAAIYNCKLVIFRMRITKVTTKTGDKGETSLGTGERVRKDHPRVNALGDLDYLNSVIGWTVGSFSDSQIVRELKKIQQDINKKREKLENEINEEINSAEKEIIDLKNKAPKKINKIAMETSADLIKHLIGEEINNSSISAIVEDLAKKNKDKYYGN